MYWTKPYNVAAALLHKFKFQRRTLSSKNTKIVYYGELNAAELIEIVW